MTGMNSQQKSHTNVHVYRFRISPDLHEMIENQTLIIKTMRKKERPKKNQHLTNPLDGPDDRKICTLSMTCSRRTHFKDLKNVSLNLIK